MGGITKIVQRSRPWYALLASVVIGLGLVWRSGLIPFSSFVTKYGGDALWALVVYLCLGLVFTRSSTARVSLSAVGLAWGIEFLQLYRAPWIDAIRSTRPGRLLLGETFNAPDLMAYGVGIAVGLVLEILWLSRRSRRSMRDT